MIASNTPKYEYLIIQQYDEVSRFCTNVGPSSGRGGGRDRIQALLTKTALELDAIKRRGLSDII